MFKVAQEVYQTMANDAGLDLSNRDFEEMLLREDKMKEFYQKIKDASIPETAELLEDIQDNEDESKHIRALMKEWEVSLQALQPHDEEAEAAADEDVVNDIRELLEEAPRLVAMILPDAIQALQKKVQDVEGEFTTLQEGVADTERRIREEVRQTVDDWQLREKFSETVDNVQKPVEAMDTIRHGKEQEVTELQAEVEQVREELRTTTESRDSLTVDKTALTSDLQKAQEELKTAKEARDSLESEKTSSANSLLDLQQQLKDAQQELEVVKNARDSFEAEKISSAISLQDVQKQLDDANQKLNDVRQELGAAKEQIKSTDKSRDAEGEEGLQLRLASCKLLLVDRVVALMGVQLEETASDRMIACQVRALSLRLLVFVTGESRIRREIPRMLFVQATKAIGPVRHAISFWISMSANEFSFADSQALFNSDIVDTESCEAYAWVLDALKIAVDSLRSWATDPFPVKRILTLFHGLAYLCFLSFAMGLPIDEVGQLRDKTVKALIQRQLLGSSLVRMVLGKVSSFIDGSPLTSWVLEPTSDREASERLDSSNSDLGPNRHLIADPSAKTFALVDGIDIDEALYAFDADDVDSVRLTGSLSLVLRFSKGHKEHIPVDDLLLDKDFPSRECVTQWIETFLPDKLH
ncbi:MAG: hypothetical protein LQ346_002982 [Caloplaca aetnensis]|nr:MAG: hypothetical protein LQ346_002982 [Caloplaca aetnensis]